MCSHLKPEWSTASSLEPSGNWERERRKEVIRTNTSIHSANLQNQGQREWTPGSGRCLSNQEVREGDKEVRSKSQVMLPPPPSLCAGLLLQLPSTTINLPLTWELDLLFLKGWISRLRTGFRAPRSKLQGQFLHLLLLSQA